MHTHARKCIYTYTQYNYNSTHTNCRLSLLDLDLDFSCALFCCLLLKRFSTVRHSVSIRTEKMSGALSGKKPHLPHCVRAVRHMNIRSCKRTLSFTCVRTSHHCHSHKTNGTSTQTRTQRKCCCLIAWSAC